MSDYLITASSKLHHMFHRKGSSINEMKLKFISFIWDDDYIENIDINQWNCLWCGVTFQGIDATKTLARVLGVRGVHDKS